LANQRVEIFEANLEIGSLIKFCFYAAQ